MHRIGITNQKGGVGKTTTAINISAGLALAGKRVLLVDMDPQGNAGSGLGISTADLQHTVFEVLMRDRTASEVLVESQVTNLSVLPSDIRLIAAEKELLSAVGRENRLLGALQSLEGQFDVVIIDSPPSLGLLTLNVLRAVNHLLIPIQSEYYALEGLSMLMETVAEVKAELNPDLEILGLLLTMVDGRTNLSKQVCQEVVGHFGDKVFKTVMARSVRLSEAPSHGLPILLYDEKSSASEAHRQLVSELLTRLEPPAMETNEPEKIEAEVAE